MKNNIVFRVFGLILCLFVLSTSLSAVEISGSYYAGFVSKYLWRGSSFGVNNIQPGMDLSFNAFTIGFWGNVAKNTGFDEADIFACYAFDLDPLSIELGYTYYTFPGLYDVGHEPYISLGLDVFASPYASYYYDLAFEAGYLELGVSQGFTAGLDFSVDVTAGYSMTEAYSSLSVLGISLSTSYMLGELEIIPVLFYQYPLDSAYSEDFSGGLSISYSFE